MRSTHHCCFRSAKMAEYEELVNSAAGYDSDDSGADTDEEVPNQDSMSVTRDEKQPGHLNTSVDLDKA